MSTRTVKAAGWPAVIAALIVVVVMAAEAADTGGAALVSLLIAASLLCGLTSSPGVARAVGIGTVAVAALSFVWNHDLESSAYWVALTVVALGAAFAWLMANYRERLVAADRELQAIFGTVGVAVMVRDASGRMVYTNDAAAELLGLPDVEAVKAATAQELMERFEVYTEDGSPVALGELPGSRILQGEPHPPPMLVRNIVKETGEERWLLNMAEAVGSPGDEGLLAVNVVEDLTETKRAELAQRLLAEAGRQATGGGDVAATLQAVAEAAVPGFADWAGVDLVEGRGITPVVAAHLDPVEIRPAGVAEVIRSGRPQLTDGSTMIVPLRAGAEVLGALTFVSSTARRFGADDVELALDLGRQVGVFVKNEQLHQERAWIARTLQAGLLPDRLPQIPGWHVSGVYRPAGAQNIAGGDFYDFVPFDGGWAVVIGDVIGKGAPAAALTALLRHTAGAILESTGDPVAALRLLNRRLYERGSERMVPCTVAVIAIKGDQALVSSAGHPLPLLRRDGAVRPIGHASLLLGVYEDAEFTAASERIRPGDRLLLYTDGVTDARGDRERFGEQRLIETFRSMNGSLDDLADQVLNAVDGFQAATQQDDIAVIGLARE